MCIIEQNLTLADSILKEWKEESLCLCLLWSMPFIIGLFELEMVLIHAASNNIAWKDIIIGDGIYPSTSFFYLVNRSSSYLCVKRLRSIWWGTDELDCLGTISMSQMVLIWSHRAGREGMLICTCQLACLYGMVMKDMEKGLPPFYNIRRWPVLFRQLLSWNIHRGHFSMI